MYSIEKVAGKIEDTVNDGITDFKDIVDNAGSTCTKEGDYDWWRQHDLDRGHFTPEQRAYFKNEAVWLCARCEDVGDRNGRKLAHMAEDKKELIHQIWAVQSKSAP